MDKIKVDEAGFVTMRIETLHELLDDLYAPRNQMERDELSDDTTPFTLEERMVFFQESINENLHLAFLYEQKMIDQANKYSKFSQKRFKEEVEYYRLSEAVRNLQEEFDKLTEEITELKKMKN